MKNRLVVVRGRGWGCVGEMGEGGQQVQMSSRKQLSPGAVMYSMMTIVNNNVLYI